MRWQLRPDDVLGSSAVALALVQWRDEGKPTH
jgi:hypothetical protein